VQHVPKPGSVLFMGEKKRSRSLSGFLIFFYQVLFINFIILHCRCHSFLYLFLVRSTPAENPSSPSFTEKTEKKSCSSGFFFSFFP